MEEKTIKCPKCGVDMAKLTNGKVIIDKCPQCEGIFLDKGEMEAIRGQGFIHYVLNWFRRDE
jgi:Zn-finger nucleic acid-binding protein